MLSIYAMKRLFSENLSDFQVFIPLIYQFLGILKIVHFLCNRCYYCEIPVFLWWSNYDRNNSGFIRQFLSSCFPSMINLFSWIFMESSIRWNCAISTDIFLLKVVQCANLFLIQIYLFYSYLFHAKNQWVSLNGTLKKEKFSVRPVKDERVKDNLRCKKYFIPINRRDFHLGFLLFFKYLLFKKKTLQRVIQI